ncbi:signal peptide-containing protein [Cryptosporidium canis]|uniref:Signal peptide-containing protein n=1 Tax=Cryptosporidium canis TaxID=195482 RepID=A0A9D5HW24_9CRYT|nr:signal peptide-containing protein [Cryptosporidium canis]
MESRVKSCGYVRGLELVMKWVLVLLGLVISGARSQDAALVTYGSTVSILHQNTKCYIFTTKITWANGNQAVTCSTETESVNFYIREADSDYKGAGTPVVCGESVRLLHTATEKFVQSNKSAKSMISRQVEIFGGSGEPSSYFRVECEKKSPGQTIDVKDRVKFYNIEAAGYLSASKKHVFDNRNCPRCPIVGQYEVTISSRSNSDCLWSFNPIMMLHSSRDSQEGSDDHSRKDEL